MKKSLKNLNSPKKIFAAGIWITFSEFIRNEILFKNFWINHFQNLNLKFETLPVNGILWMVWSFSLAYLVFKLIQKYSFGETIAIAWLGAFVMMWITLYNLQVLPLNLLWVATPLSLFEVFIATVLLQKK